MNTVRIFFLACLSVCIYTANAQHLPCVTRKTMDSIHVRATGRPIVQNPVQTQLLSWTHAFRWPMVAAAHYRQPGFYYISNYVDLRNQTGDDDTATLEDYNCGKRTYDVPASSENPSGYNHSGIDIAVGPFGWTMMDNENVYVVAAEPGIIIARHDGEWSRTCKQGHSATDAGNYIAIQHSDSIVTYYMHMKSGTVTSKDSGDIVQEGEYLGVVGSSGNSTGPHLHFETRSPWGSILDPFQNGPCHDSAFGLINGSFWANEEPYLNKKILSVFTLSGPWTPRSCDTSGVTNGVSEIVPYCNHFNPNSFVYFSASVRDMTTPTTVRLRLYSPSDVELYDYVFDITQYDKEVTIPVQLYLLGSTVGTYKLLCTYNGISEPHYFTVGCPPSQTLSGSPSSNTGVISGGSISSTQIIPPTAENVEYQAETFIQFNPGFHAQSGADLVARIDACTASGQRMGAMEKPGQRPVEPKTMSPANKKAGYKTGF